MADTTATSQSKSQNSASDSSTATDAQDQKTGKASTDQASGSTDNDNSQNNSNDVEAHIAAIRRDARHSERRRLVGILKNAGFDVNNKNLDDVLKGLNTSGGKKDTANNDDKKSKKDPQNDDTSEEAKLLRTRLQDLEQKLQEKDAMQKRVAVDAAISRAVAGVEFANERAAEDAMIAFSKAYEFDLADDGRTVRVLGSDGEPVLHKKTYKEMTVREAFDQFIAERPHFKKAEKRGSTTMESQKGTTDKNQGMNDLFRRAIGVQ